MRNVAWSARALNDLNSTFQFIARDTDQNANLVVDRIDAAAKLLGQTPIGRYGRVSGTYEKPVRRAPYIIIYALSDDSVVILRIIHGARDWPENEWPAN